MKNIIFPSIFLIFWASGSFAQEPGVYWTQIYGGTGHDTPAGILQMNDGGFLIGGSTISFGLTLYKYYLVRTDEEGDTVWTRLYGRDNRSQSMTSLQPSADGGCILAGGSDAPFLDTEVYLVRLNSDFDTVWTLLWGEDSYEEVARCAIESYDQGVIAVGDYWNATGGTILALETNAGGEVKWHCEYDWPLADYGYCICKAQENDGYVICGSRQSDITFTRDALLIRVNSDGDTLWTRTYGGDQDDEAYHVMTTSDGGYLLTGYSSSTPTTDKSVFVVKTNAAGDTSWTQKIGENNLNVGFSAIETEDGGYTVVGTSYALGTADMLVAKLDSYGDIVWMGYYIFWEIVDEFGSNMIEVPPEEYVVCGSRQLGLAGDLDINFFKIGPIIPGSQEYHSFQSMTIQPNPVRDEAILGYSLQTDGPVCISIFDCSGALVMELVNKVQTKGQFRIEANLTNLKKGIYLVRLTTEDVITVARLVKQ
jgi:hypothetical protein